MPVPGGIPLAEAEELLRAVARDGTVVGAGLSGLLPEPANVEPADAPLRGARACSRPLGTARV